MEMQRQKTMSEDLSVAVQLGAQRNDRSQTLLFSYLERVDQITSLIYSKLKLLSISQQREQQQQQQRQDDDDREKEDHDDKDKTIRTNQIGDTQSDLMPLFSQSEVETVQNLMKETTDLKEQMHDLRNEPDIVYPTMLPEYLPHPPPSSDNYGDHSGWLTFYHRWWP